MTEANATRMDDFYPRSPRGERHFRCSFGSYPSQFLSTLPSRGATVTASIILDWLISIHAPLAGSDLEYILDTSIRISIHAPLAGSDRIVHLPLIRERLFQSTLPSRGATCNDDTYWRRIKNFYPRSPRGERPLKSTIQFLHRQFLSTLPSRGATWSRTFGLYITGFLSTLPSRGATTGIPNWPWIPGYFYPRSPRGERPSTLPPTYPSRFLSTLPSRGATHADIHLVIEIAISIHAPLAGSDKVCWQRLRKPSKISIHAPLAGSDR